jgi:hypothetical protein
MIPMNELKQIYQDAFQHSHESGLAAIAGAVETAARAEFTAMFNAATTQPPPVAAGASQATPETSVAAGAGVPGTVAPSKGEQIV